MRTSGAPGDTIPAGTNTRNSRRVGAHSMEIPWNSPSGAEARELHVQVSAGRIGVDVDLVVGPEVDHLLELLELHRVVIWNGSCRLDSP